MGMPIHLVSSPPPGASQVPTRTLEQLLHANPISVGDCRDDLSLALSPEFPRFDFTTLPPDAIVTVPRELTNDERAELVTAFTALQIDMNLKVEVKPLKTPLSLPQELQDKLRMAMGPRLTPSKQLPPSFGIDVRLVAEEDESFWNDNKGRALSGLVSRAADLLPPVLTIRSSRCLVDAALAPVLNVRIYLSLYREVLLVAPRKEFYPAVLASLGVSEDELVWLALVGRITLLLPDSLESYMPSLINKVAADSPTALLMSRRLALATVTDSRQRFPLAYPPLDVDQRAALLRDLWRSLAARSGMDRVYAEALLGHLSEVWCEDINHVFRAGALGTARLGAAPLIAQLMKLTEGVDRFVELTSASAAVEWSAALGATLFPAHYGGYSAQTASEVMAAVYSGVEDRQPVDVNFGAVEAALQGILLVENDAPIREFVGALQGEDVDRLRKVVEKIAEENLDPDFLVSAIDAFNQQIRTFERRETHLRALDVLTPVGILAHRPFLSVGFWALKYLIGMPTGGAVADLVRGIATWSPSDTVLVSRLRRRLKS